MRFMRLGVEGAVPDVKAIWLFREQLTRATTKIALADRAPASGLRGPGKGAEAAPAAKFTSTSMKSWLFEMSEW